MQDNISPQARALPQPVSSIVLGFNASHQLAKSEKLPLQYEMKPFPYFGVQPTMDKNYTTCKLNLRSFVLL
jgi:hypothetical protein